MPFDNVSVQWKIEKQKGDKEKIVIGATTRMLRLNLRLFIQYFPVSLASRLHMWEEPKELADIGRNCGSGAAMSGAGRLPGTLGSRTYSGIF